MEWRSRGRGLAGMGAGKPIQGGESNGGFGKSHDFFHVTNDILIIQNNFI
jgi:hypothetical protein